jgi:hypothetical protein
MGFIGISARVAVGQDPCRWSSSDKRAPQHLACRAAALRAVLQRYLCVRPQDVIEMRSTCCATSATDAPLGRSRAGDSHGRAAWSYDSSRAALSHIRKLRVARKSNKFKNLRNRLVVLASRASHGDGARRGCATGVVSRHMIDLPRRDQRESSSRAERLIDITQRAPRSARRARHR